ncbi:hypothetical protein P7C70_g1465, partial [Phenoliferia sp. Uapishka_3]
MSGASWDFRTVLTILLIKPRRYRSKSYWVTLQLAIGVEFGSRLVSLTEGKDVGKKVKLQIWDTAGQESFRSITRSYYRGAGGALLVFDLTQRSSYISCRSWLADLRQWGEPDLCILLVGQKSDLCEAEGDEDDEVAEEVEMAGSPAKGKGGLRKRAVSRKEVNAWVQEEGLAGYVETSAKEGTGVEEVRAVSPRDE